VRRADNGDDRREDIIIAGAPSLSHPAVVENIQEDRT
jgi:hypothetical protein